MHTLVVGASRASWAHACPYQGSVWGFNGLKIELVLGVVTLVVGMAPKSFVVDVEGLCGVFPSIPLP